MATKYRDFTETEQNGQTYVIARPTSERDEPVRLDGTLFGEEIDDGEWTEVVSRLIRFDMSGALNLEAGEGQMSREDAVESLLGSDIDAVNVSSESEAQALIDYFASEGVFEVENGSVVLLRSPDSDGDEVDINAKMLMNWVSAIDGCIDKIDETVDTIESARQELEAEMGDTSETEIVQDFESQQQQVAQQLANLAGGTDISSIEEVPEADRDEFRRLKQQFYHLETMKEAAQKGTMGTEIEEAATKLADKRNQLENLKSVLRQKRDDIRKAVVQKRIFPDNAIDLVQNLEGLVTSLTGIESSHDRADDKSMSDTMSDVSEMLGHTDNLDQATSEAGLADEGGTIEQG